MTKKETLRAWLNEQPCKYSSTSNFHLGYGDGWNWVRDTLKPAITKNAMFLTALDFAFAEIERFMKERKNKEKKEGNALYTIGFMDGVEDSTKAIKRRLKN